jgi:hypothetical protein
MYDELNAMVYKCLISPTRNEKIDNMILFCECILFKYTKLQKYQPNEKFHNLLIQKIDDFMLELNNSNDDENHSNKDKSEYLLFLLSEITKEMHQNNEKIIEEKEKLIGKNQELMIKIKEMIKEKKEKILKIDEKIAKLCNIQLPLLKKSIDNLQKKQLTNDQPAEQLTNDQPAEQLNEKPAEPLRRSERIRLKNVSNRL